MIAAYLIDSAWTLIALIGVGVSTWAVIDSYLDRRSRERRGIDGIAKLIVVMNLRGALASLYLHGFFLILGINAFLNITPAETSALYILLVSGFIFVALANVRAVGLNQLERLRLRQRE